MKPEFQTNTRTELTNTNKGEFTFSFWASLYADDAATPLASCEALLVATNAMYEEGVISGSNITTLRQLSFLDKRICSATEQGTRSAYSELV